ncbi:Rhamnogalacturonyl hydrolase YesR [Alteromonadaceae bacterium Bs31]|nr:Rhamnogalacturonyl hydrolase YesR [Alteromonadaceae bacterium Bs31]
MTKNLHRLAILSGSLALLGGCDSEPASSIENSPAKQTPITQSVAQIEISNPSSFDRPNTNQYLSFYDLGLAENADINNQLVVLQGENQLPSQLIDKDANGEIDGITFSVDLSAAQTLNLEIVADAVKSQTTFKKLTQAEISTKDGGNWVQHEKSENHKQYEGGSFKNVSSLTPPEYYTDHSNWIRYEGPGIESDKVAYRVYLDWRNGFDIFGKSVAEPVLQKVGQDGYESYHHMQPWGMDILKVGQSLGAGGFGFWDGEKVHIVKDTSSRSATITNNGPLLSSFNLLYKDWNINNQTLDLDANFAMSVGSRLVHTELKVSESVPNIAIGVVKHKNTEAITGNQDITGDAYTYLASWGKQSLAEDNLGMAVFFRMRDFNKIVNDEKSYTAVMEARGDYLDYYFGAAWQGEHGKGVSSKEEFVAWLDKQAEILTLTPRIRIKSALSKQAKSDKLTAEQALEWSKKLADSELKRKALGYHAGGWDVNRRRSPKFEYDIIGLQPKAFYRLSEVSGDKAHEQVLEKVTGSFIKDNGDIHAYKMSNYNIDAVAPGRAVLQLYKDTGEEKYKIAAGHLRKQLEGQPKTSEGAFWHKKKYDWQLWLDGVYMGMPFLAEYSAMFEDNHSMHEVVTEFVLTRKYLRDSETGLYYHAWDEKKQQVWADPETGLSPEFWARGVGWLAMALVDVLELLPEDDKELREPLLQMSAELAEALVKYQDKETGTWWQIMDAPGKTGNYRESSATAMFSYFLSKGIRLGYISDEYKQTAIHAYQGMINEFVNVHADGTISMTNQCLVAGLGFGRDGSYGYYMSEMIFENDPKGNGPFILSGIEMYKLLKGV